MWQNAHTHDFMCCCNLNYRVVAMYVYDATQVGVKCDYTRSASWAKASHKEPTRPMSIASPVHRSCTGKCAFCDCIARKYRYVTYMQRQILQTEI